MILFFGTRPGKPETIKLLNATCPYCQLMGTLNAVTQKNYFHLFWIKLFKIYSNTTVECSHCKRGYYESEFTDEISRELSRIKK
ncbi:zinc-ribbon domain-containing protein [uncultured Maribacter sp.]|uniref:zinc-ribbon domain-containing protein n=1 Tax=uncultured Maribacter sp. TaxID=431308 RepID=UPI0030D861AE|tara:strand:+ start:868 stop:1119 length:252 start_codon:yes stop_codon:yes gene_type:complete